MSRDAFLEAPWKTSHAAYDKSAFNIRPAPEFATAEVVVASTYRAAGFPKQPESDVPAAGRDLDKRSNKQPRHAGRGDFSKISADTWRTILHGALESPKQPNQSSRRFLQLCPIVPDVTLYSGSARLTGNSWNPGALVAKLIQFGAPCDSDARRLWALLHEGLSIDQHDDIWARWLQEEFEERRPPQHIWAPTELSLDPSTSFLDGGGLGLRIPASKFVQDLEAILRAKPHMTRRQWISLLEAVMRIGVVSHVMWLCHVNDRIWRSIRRVLVGDSAPDASSIRVDVLASDETPLVYGSAAVPIMRDLASRYLTSRLGINLTLWELDRLGHPTRSVSSIQDLSHLMAAVVRHRDKLHSVGLLETLRLVNDAQSRTIACKKGIGSNLIEFFRHVLGQRQTADVTLRGYDQGYFLKKKAEYSAAPWVVSLGPVALIALVHCCLEEAAGPRSVQRLCEHAAWYGLDIDRSDIGNSELGHKLRMLGLVLDSPDAESGMLLIPPFNVASHASTEADA